jgi:hypothetical protein
MATMLFTIRITRSYVVEEAAEATVEAAGKKQAIEAVWNDFDVLNWETLDEEPMQDSKVTCRRIKAIPPDFRAVGGVLRRWEDSPTRPDVTDERSAVP